MQSTSVRRFAASLLRAKGAQAASSSKAETASAALSAKQQQKQKATEEQPASEHLQSSSPSPPFEDPATYFKAVRVDPSKPFNLAAFHPILDVHPDMYQGSEAARAVDIHSPFKPPSPEILEKLKVMAAGSDSDPLLALAADASTSFGTKDLRGLHRYPLVVNRVVNMTSKGKIASMYALVVVGNGKGLLGYGEGKGEGATQAMDKAFVQAVKNMDYVQRKDARTIWADLMTGKWGATTVELRSRPPGFGLRTSPIIHQIAKAAGILDLSAKIRGSRNGMNTVKATINLLHGGAAPQGLGDISGKEKLARRFKGRGMRTSTEIGLDLGRKAVELR